MSKIVNVTQAFAGGVFSSVSYCCNAMVDAGHDVTLIVTILPETPEDIRARLDDRVKVIELFMTRGISPVKDFISTLKLISILKKISPDILHLHSSKAGALGRVAAVFFRSTDVYYSPRGLAFLQNDCTGFSRAAFRVIEKVLHCFGGSVVACSESELAEIKCKLSSRNVFLVENAVDIDEVRALSCSVDVAEAADVGDPITICTIGRLSPQKGVEVFSELARSVIEARVGVRFVWIGGGDYRREMLLNTKVEITGWLSPREVIPILSRADIYVQTSHWEGMPLALIEAQVLGKPAVVTDVVGNRDVVVNGFTGFTCADKTDLKEKLLSMIDDSKLRKQIGKNSYSYSVDRFGLKRLQKDLNNLYFT